jgi:SAM-dependent methyltransferase
MAKYIPNDFSRQISLERFTELLLTNHSVENVLDLGCGIGNSADMFFKMNANITWTGVDIENSPEVMQRERQDLNFITFDGVKLPFPNNYFDLIYCKQVFEHVRYPEPLLKEIQRVLTPGGFFIGSTSHLEPYHSFSYWNYTPYGFVTLLEETGLQIIEMRPSIDAITLIIRRIMGGIKIFNVFWKIDSPLNAMVELFGKLLGKKAQWRNIVKLLFCGQFLFSAKKPSD